jgi:uncharacterized protein DUF1206
MAVGSAPHRATEEAERAGAQLQRSAGFPWLARGGLLARGVVYGVIGAIALEVAAGTGARPTNQQGALELIAREPLGSVLLAVLAAGLAGYSAWRLTRAVTGRGREQTDSGFDRVAGAASGIAYLLLCAVAIEILVSASAGGGSTSKQTGGVLGWPAGPELVAVAGAVLIGVGAYQAYKGLARKFMESSRTSEMDPAVRRAYAVVGVFGHVARGVVFVLIGYGLVRAGIEYNPRKATGLDGALRELAHASYGPELLGLVAAGFIAFAIYSTADARYRKI